MKLCEGGSKKIAPLIHKLSVIWRAVLILYPRLRLGFVSSLFLQDEYISNIIRVLWVFKILATGYCDTENENSLIKKGSFPACLHNYQTPRYSVSLSVDTFSPNPTLLLLASKPSFRSHMHIRTTTDWPLKVILPHSTVITKQSQSPWSVLQKTK